MILDCFTISVDFFGADAADLFIIAAFRELFEDRSIYSSVRVTPVHVGGRI